MNSKMDYSILTTSNKNFIKRLTHSKRFKIASKLIEKYDPFTYLDYGTGDGELIKYISNKSKKKIYVFEPNEKMRKNLTYNLNNYDCEIIKTFEGTSEIYQNFFDLISINEVFEHLNENDCIETFKILKKIGKKNVKLIISVPIEIGIASLFKNIIRIMTKQTHPDTNFKNIFKSLLSMHIQRPNLKYNNSHIGFNYKNFINLIKNQNIDIKNISFSPYNFLGKNFNSQLFVEAKFSN